MANGSTTGPSDSFLSSYFSNPFKSKKKKPDVQLKLGYGESRDPRTVKGTAENVDYEAKKRSGGALSRFIFDKTRGK